MKLEIEQELFDFLIVGSGLVGLVAAIRLHQLGYRVGLLNEGPILLPEVDKEDKEDFTDTRAIALSYGSIEILKNMGLWDSLFLEQQATDIKKIHVSEQGNFGTFQLEAKKDFSAEYLGKVISIKYLIKSLRLYLSRLEELSRFDYFKVEKIEKSENKSIENIIYEISSSGSHPVKKLYTRWLLIAEGADSSSRDSLGIEVLEKKFNQSAIVGNLILKNTNLNLENIAYERFTKTGPLALLPCGNSQMTYIWSLKSNEAEDFLLLDAKFFLEKLQQAFGYKAGCFEKIVSRKIYPLVQKVAVSHYVDLDSSILLLGNAAHALHPIAGQGFNLSLRDLNVFLGLLAEDKNLIKTPRDWLISYEKLRAKDQKEIADFSGFLAQIFYPDWIKPVRSLGFFLLARSEIIKKIMVKKLAGL